MATENPVIIIARPADYIHNVCTTYRSFRRFDFPHVKNACRHRNETVEVRDCMQKLAAMIRQGVGLFIRHEVRIRYIGR